MLDKYINDAIMTFWSGPRDCRITCSAPQHHLDWTVNGDADDAIGRTEGMLRQCGRS